MIDKEFSKLIPYISENFITYPLWEEGKYIPFINFWQKLETEKEYIKFNKKLKYIFNKLGYGFYCKEDYHKCVIYEYQIYPKFKELKNGSYKFIKKDWSIEEIINCLYYNLN